MSTGTDFFSFYCIPGVVIILHSTRKNYYLQCRLKPEAGGA